MPYERQIPIPPLLQLATRSEIAALLWRIRKVRHQLRNSGKYILGRKIPRLTPKA